MKKLKSGFDKLKYFDAYTKLNEDFQEKTFFGGAVSIVCWLTILFLISLRVHQFLTVTETEETIFVDTSRSPKLRINLDIIFGQISCGYLSLDAMDSSGEQHLHVDDHIYKRRLDLHGNPLEEPSKQSVGQTIVIKKDGDKVDMVDAKDINNTATSTEKCGSCYGAIIPSLNRTCCNTCEEVKEAYRIMGWSVNESKFDQCKSSKHVQEIEKAFKEGCQIYGYMEVNRVSGSFHVAPGQSFSINHMHVHDVQPYSSSTFNTSHLIQKLSYGAHSSDSLNSRFQDKVNIDPLAGTHSTATQGGTMFNYYIKIVPTLVKTEGATIQTYQYSVTKHEKVVTPSSGESGMPGVFFSYEISALMHKVTDKHIPWSHLATDICSIIGGVWVVSMFIDHLFYRSTKFFAKIDLGKAS